MTNRYFNNTPDLIPFSRARASQVEANIDGIAVGLDQVEVEMDAAIRVPNGEVMPLLPAAALRINKGLIFDSAGLPTVATIATQSEMNAAVAASASAAASLASFRSQYLGPATSDPSVDGNGNAVGPGDIYFNTATNRFRVFNGTSWQNGVDTSGGIVPDSRLVSAGSGLTGGGSLAADRTISVASNGITDAMLRASTATSIIGRSAGTSGNVADIAATSDGQFLRRASGALAFAALASADISGALGYTPANAAGQNYTGTHNFTGALQVGGSAVWHAGNFNPSALNASNLTSGTVPDARFPAVLPAVSGANLTALNAAQITTGTLPDARFPATLPAISGANLTNLNGGAIASGTVAAARLGSGTPTSSNFLRGDGTWQNISGTLPGGGTTAQFLRGDSTWSSTIVGTLTATTFSGAHSGDGSALTALNASQLTSGTVPDARFPATLPAVSGANLTALNAAQVTTGTLPVARLNGGTTGQFVRGDGAYSNSLIGDVGVGVSPGVRLDVQSASGVEGTIRLTSPIDGSVATPRASSFSFRSGSALVETARIASFNRFANVSGGDLVFSTANSSNVLQARGIIDSSGNLGIGTTSPGYRVDVVDSGGNVLRLGNGTAQVGSFISASLPYLGSLSNHPLALGTNATEQVRITVTGDVGIGTTGPVGRFAVAGSSGVQVVIDSDANRGWVQSYGSRPLQLNPIGNDIAMCLAGGSVGIATSNVGSYGLSLSQSANLSWDQSATESIATIFRQANSAALVLASGYKRSSTANGFASSFASSWAKTAISVGGTGSGVISFYVDAAAAVSVGTDITPTERMRIASTGTTIYAPASGTTLVVNAASAGIATEFNDGTRIARHQFNATNYQFGSFSAHGVDFVSNSVQRMNLSLSGNLAVNAPTSGDHTIAHSVGGSQAIGYLGIPRSTTATTLVVADRGKCVAVAAGITVPNSTFAAGDAVSIYNDSASAITITQGASLTLRQAGTTNTGNRTLAARGMATVWFNSASEAVITGAGVS